MKNIVATIAVVFCFLVVISFGQRAIAQSDSYYIQYVDKKIAELERQGKMVESRSSCVRGCAEFKILKANFYRAHKEELVRAMVMLKVEMKPYKINYFLIKALSKASPKLVCQHCSSHHSS